MKFNRYVLKIFFLSRIFVVCCALIGSAVIGSSNMSGLWNIEVPFFNLFARWDSAQYISIAKSGYVTDMNWAYRPLFPAMLRLVSLPLSPPLYIDIGIAIAGFFANAVLFLLALFLIHSLTARLFSKQVADDTVLLVTFCPTAIFFSAIYSESLLILLFAASFICLENGGVFKSGIVGYLAGLTRPEGIFISIAISAKSLLKPNSTRRKIAGLISAFVAFSALFTAIVLAWIVRGDPLIIFSIESTWDHVTFPQAFNHPSWIMDPGFIQFYAVSLSMMAICLLTVFPFFMRKPKKVLGDPLFPYYACAAFSVIFYLVVGDIRSLSRYFSIIIPVYWTLALWLGKRPHSKILIMLVFLMQLALGTILFVNWYHFI